MKRLTGLRVFVTGGGAVGSATAWRLQAEGARVILCDPAPLADNASGVAAGMLAPAFEAALDPASRGHFPILKAARDLWPDLAEATAPFGGRLDRSGALWIGDDASQADMLAALQGVGARADRTSAAEAEGASPGLRAPTGAVHTSEDWRLEPRAMLGALREAFVAAGGEVRPVGLREFPSDADVWVLATGLEPAGLTGRVAELACLSPIKGQIARFPGTGPFAGPALRAPGVYLAPSADGAAAGATMEAGLADRTIMPAALEQLRDLAARMVPALAGARLSGEAGVRAATPDGLPLVGPSADPRMMLALGARRNGWLLAPLMAQIVADRLAGADAGPWAGALDARRFTPPG